MRNTTTSLPQYRELPTDGKALLLIGRKKITEREQKRLYFKEQEDRDLFMYDIRKFHPLTSILWKTCIPYPPKSSPLTQPTSALPLAARPRGQWNSPSPAPLMPSIGGTTNTAIAHPSGWNGWWSAATETSSTAMRPTSLSWHGLCYTALGAIRATQAAYVSRWIPSTYDERPPAVVSRWISTTYRSSP